MGIKKEEKQNFGLSDFAINWAENEIKKIDKEIEEEKKDNKRKKEITKIHDNIMKILFGNSLTKSERIELLKNILLEI